jgi:hypothetical protein
MIPSLLFINFQIVESKKNLPFPSINLHPDQSNEDSSKTFLRYSGNGKFHNITILEPTSPKLSHKLPPSLFPLPNVESRLGLDIKQVILTNLDVDKPRPVVINSHEDYSRDNDGFEFSNRYIVDENSAIGTTYKLIKYGIYMSIY